MAEAQAAPQIGTELAVRAFEGSVHISFPRPMTDVMLDAQTAGALGEQMARCAYEARFGVVPPQCGSQIKADKLVRVSRRVALMLGSFARDGKLSDDPNKNQMAAQSIVDTILSEVM